VLRGGAFNNEDRNVRCAYRNRNNPNNRNNNIGFRVVVVSRFSVFAKMSARPVQGGDSRLRLLGKMAGRIPGWFYCRNLRGLRDLGGLEAGIRRI
jgi:hypothetical protein